MKKKKKNKTKQKTGQGKPVTGAKTEKKKPGRKKKETAVTSGPGNETAADPKPKTKKQKSNPKKENNSQSKENSGDVLANVIMVGIGSFTPKVVLIGEYIKKK
jgi:hypothetical protein